MAKSIFTPMEKFNEILVVYKLKSSNIGEYEGSISEYSTMRRSCLITTHAG